MTVIITDEKPRKIELTPIEIDIIKDCLEHQSYALVKFYGVKRFECLIKKLEDK